jgi:hypothetical protein
MTPTAMSRRTPPRPSATARSRFFFAGSSSASAARANAAASASTIESAEGQVPSSLRARARTPAQKLVARQTGFMRNIREFDGVLASVEATKRDGQDRALARRPRVLGFSH